VKRGGDGIYNKSGKNVSGKKKRPNCLNNSSLWVIAEVMMAFRSSGENKRGILSEGPFNLRQQKDPAKGQLLQHIFGRHETQGKGVEMKITTRLQG